MNYFAEREANPVEKADKSVGNVSKSVSKGTTASGQDNDSDDEPKSKPGDKADIKDYKNSKLNEGILVKSFKQKYFYRT